jgi:osmotically-inducible protein OsmY
LHDHEINAAAVAALRAEPRLRNTSLWTITQRKFVFVQGCVRDGSQRRLIVDTVKKVARVEYVVDELLVGTRGKPPYAVVPAQ